MKAQAPYQLEKITKQITANPIGIKASVSSGKAEKSTLKPVKINDRIRNNFLIF